MTKGKSWCEIDELIWETNTDGRSGRRSNVLAASTSHEAGRAKVVRELHVPRSVLQAQGNRSAIGVPEACSCTKSDTRWLYVKQQLQ